MTICAHPPPCDAAPLTSVCRLANVTALGAYAFVANQLAGGSVSTAPPGDTPPTVRALPYWHPFTMAWTVALLVPPGYAKPTGVSPCCRMAVRSLQTCCVGLG